MVVLISDSCHTRHGVFTEIVTFSNSIVQENNIYKWLATLKNVAEPPITALYDKTRFILHAKIKDFSFISSNPDWINF